MTSPVSRLPLSTAQIAVLQARPVPKAAPVAPLRKPAEPAVAAAPQPPAAPRAPAAGAARLPHRGSLLDIVA
jgi:hypothetical protein